MPGDGYSKSWQTISVSHNGPHLAVILGNPAMIEAYKAGIPGNAKPFPDGARMAKIHWNTKENKAQPGPPVQPTTQSDVDFMVKTVRGSRTAAGGVMRRSTTTHRAIHFHLLLPRISRRREMMPSANSDVIP